MRSAISKGNGTALYKLFKTFHDTPAARAPRGTRAHSDDDRHMRHLRVLLDRMQTMSVEECMDAVAPLQPSNCQRLLHDACPTLNSAIYAAAAFCVNNDFEKRGQAAVREYMQLVLESKQALPSRGDCEVIGLIGRSTCHAFLRCQMCPESLRKAVGARLVYLIAFGDENRPAPLAARAPPGVSA